MKYVTFIMAFILAMAGCSYNKKKNENNTNNINNTNNTNNANNTNNINNINNTNNGNHQAQAVFGQRCPDNDRIGFVYVSGYANGDLQVWGDVQDRKPLRRTEPKLQDENCVFSEELPPGFCADCPPQNWCTHEGECVPYPATVDGLRVELTAGADVQAFEPQNGGGVYGTVTLPGDTFGARVTWGADFEVTVEPMQVPSPLETLTGVLQGGHDNPTALDLSWTAPENPARIYTFIPMNHHAGTATNTQCDIDAATGSLHIDGAMLTPLAVVTGLEFQDVAHMRFAAAQVEGGCVEFRFFRTAYPNFQK